jgi:hypothetical protein
MDEHNISQDDNKYLLCNPCNTKNNLAATDQQCKVHQSSIQAVPCKISPQLLEYCMNNGGKGAPRQMKMKFHTLHELSCLLESLQSKILTKRRYLPCLRF